MLAAAIVAAGVGLAVALSRGDDAAEPVLVDERRGVLGGVRFGESAREVRARLGEPTDDEPGVFPAGADFTGPPSIPVPRSDPGKGAPETLHYGDTAYLVSSTAGVFSMVTLAEGARTRGGVAIGDDLERVRERYKRVECGEAVGGEGAFGEAPKYQWCRVVGDVHVFFGDDPIESITLSSTAARG